LPKLQCATPSGNGPAGSVGYLTLEKEKRMNKVVISSLVAAVALLAVVSRVAMAEEVKHEGTISKIEGATVTVKAADAQHEMTLSPTTKITLDGKPARASDLKVGFKVKTVCEKEGDRVTCKQFDATSGAN